MARRRRNNEYDEMGYQDDPRSGGDYYPESDNGMTDPRPQRRRGDGRGRGGAPRGGDPRGVRGYDEPGEMGGGYDDYPAPQEQKKGGALKVILIIIVVLILMALSCLGGIFMSLTLAGQGKLPDNIVQQFNLPTAEPEVDSEDLLSSYGSEVAEAVKSGKVEELLEAEKTAAAQPSTTTPGAAATTTPGMADPYGTGQQQVTDPSMQQQQLDPTQQQVTDPSMQQQQVVDPTQQQQQVVNPTQQQQQVIDPNQQQMQQQQQQVMNPNQQQMQQ